MSNRFDPGAAPSPPKPKLDTPEVEPQSTLRSGVHIPFGRFIVDRLTVYLGTPLRKISPLLGKPWDNSAQLRTLLGNGYLIFPAAGAYLGAWAIKNTHGLAVPPVLWLTLVIAVLGIFDAFSGMVATLVFTVGVIATGHLFSSHLVTGPPGTQGMLFAFTGILTMAFIWFIGAQLPRRLRILGFNTIKNTFQRRYVIWADFFVITLLMILILGSVPIFVPIFTGADRQSLTQVTIQNHLDIIKWVVGIAAVLRTALDTFVHMKFHPLRQTTGRQRGALGRWILRIVASAIALALIWEIVGTVWEWPVIWVLLISLDLLSAIGERFLKPSAIYRFVPRNLFRIVTLLLLTQYGARILSGHIVTGSQLLAWLVLLVVVAVAIYAILDGPDDNEEGDRPATWITRLIGMIVVILLFVISQGFFGIPATPYANPTAVAVGNNGTLFIADSGNNRVVEVSLNGNRYDVGTGLSNPSGVAVNPTSSSASIFVADTGNNRVLSIGLTPRQALLIGRHVRIGDAVSPGSQISVGTGFLHPTGLATDPSGRLFVADTGNNRVVEISPSGVQRTLLSHLSSPTALSADVFGRLYVANTGAGTIIRYNISKSGRALKPKVIASGLSSPEGVAADAQGNVYVSEASNNRVFEIRSNGQHVRIQGSFLHPHGIAVDGAGHLYVADTGHGTVELIEPIFIPTVLTRGPNTSATAVARANDGSYYVVNSHAGTLEHVTAHSTTVLVRNLNLPSGVAWTAINRLYVSQQGNGTILRVNPTTGSVTILSQGLLGITALTPDPYGGMFAVSPSTGKLYAVSAQGASHVLYTKLATPVSVVQDAYDNLVVTLLGTSAHSGAVWRIVPGGKAEILASGLSSPGGIAADFNGDVYFIERGTNRVWEDRGLLGAQIVWQGTGLRSNPSAIASDTAGNLVVFPQGGHLEIVLRNSTVTYQL